MKLTSAGRGKDGFSYFYFKTIIYRLTIKLLPSAVARSVACPLRMQAVPRSTLGYRPFFRGEF